MVFRRVMVGRIAIEVGYVRVTDRIVGCTLECVMNIKKIMRLYNYTMVKTMARMTIAMVTDQISVAPPLIPESLVPTEA